MARETPPKTVPELVELPSSNLYVTSIGAAIFILMLNHADVIWDQSDATTQNAWFLCTLCASNLKPGQSLGEGFLYQESAVGRVLLSMLFYFFINQYGKGCLYFDTITINLFTNNFQTYHGKTQFRIRLILFYIFMQLMNGTLFCCPVHLNKSLVITRL